MKDAPSKNYDAYGAVAELFTMRDPRILVEGPANTGKSRGILEFGESEAWRCPGIRILLVRKTLQSLRESAMVTLEEKVWWPDHPAKNGTATRATRRRYVYPKLAAPPIANDPVSSTIVLGGLENPGWTFSMEYDLILAFEAWELTVDNIESLYRANRNHVRCRYAPWNLPLAEYVRFNFQSKLWLALHGGVPGGEIERIKDPEVRALVRKDPELQRIALACGCHQQIIMDTNPRGAFHQLNRMAASISGEAIELMKNERAPSSRVWRSPKHPFVRVLSRHEDNPACTEDDLAKLRALTGARRANLYLGLWQSEDGQIWEDFDPTIHMMSARIVREGEKAPGAGTETVDMRPMALAVSVDHPMHAVLGDRVSIDWCFATMDFGFRRAGCLQVWLVDRERRMYRAVEIYWRGKLDDWWADKVVELFLAFNLRTLVCDSAEPDRIVKLNDRLTEVLKKRKGEPIARGVNKSVTKGGKGFVLTSIDLVRDLFDPKQAGGPRMFFLRDAHWFGIQQELRDDFKPASTEEEIPSYVFKKHEDGSPDEETPDENCEDHGCDATRYAAIFGWPMLEQGDEWQRAPKHPIGSAGWRLQHDNVVAAMEAAQDEEELELGRLMEEMREE